MRSPPKPLPMTNRPGVIVRNPVQSSLPVPQQPQARLQSPGRGTTTYPINPSNLQGVVGTVPSVVPTSSTGTRIGRASSGGRVVPNVSGGGTAGAYGSPYGATMASAYLAPTQQSVGSSTSRSGRTVPVGSPSRGGLYDEQEETESAFSWFDQIRAWDVPEEEAGKIAEALEAQGFEEQDIGRLTREELTYLPITIKGAHIARIMDGVRRHMTVRSRK